jgi:ATP-dependent DNA ligase
MSTERSGEWVPLRPQPVAEVRYDHVSGGRFRHGIRFLRWRPDKVPKQCTFDPDWRPYPCHAVLTRPVGFVQARRRDCHGLIAGPA